MAQTPGAAAADAGQVAAYLVLWWDGWEVHRTYLPDLPGADAVAAARHGIKVRLAAVDPMPSMEQVKAASRNCAPASRVVP